MLSPVVQFFVLTPPPPSSGRPFFFVCVGSGSREMSLCALADGAGLDCGGQTGRPVGWKCCGVGCGRGEKPVESVTLVRENESMKNDEITRK